MRTKNVFKSLVVASTLLLSSLVNATNYFASPSGSGDGLSYSSPATLTAGISKLTNANGDTLFLLGGEYDLTSNVSINKSGVAGKYTVIMNYPGEKPILDFRGQAYGERGITISSQASYLYLKGLTIRYAGKNGILQQGSYCVMEGFDVYGCCDTGIQHKTGGNNKIINCDSHDNFDYENGGTTAADFGGNADGFADKQYSGDPNYYYGCRSWHNSDDGWDFFQRVGTGTVIENCICYKNGPASFNMMNHPRYNTDKAWFDQFPKTVTDADGNSKSITLASYTNMGNGNGFKIGGDYTANNLTLENCLSVGNLARGYDQNNNAGAMVVYNCSAYDNATNYGFSKVTGSSLTIENCASFASQSSDYFQCPTIVANKNNTWNEAVTCNAVDFMSLDSTKIIVSRNSNDSLANITFMHLAEGSDLIDAGTNVGLPYSGSAPDMGCYEYGDMTNYPAALSCTTSNLSQGITEGSAISAISFKWSGGATGVTVGNLPDGLSQVTDATAKTVIVSGTPTATSGSLSFEVTTVGGTGDAVTLTAAITIKSGSAKSVAFVTTTGGAASDAPILAKLNANADFNVSIVDMTATGSASYDYSAYDLIIISPAPSSSATGMAHLEGYAKPMLLLKSFSLKPTIWNWGTAVNTFDTKVTASTTGASHAIFTGLDTNSLTLFSSVSTNGVTGITHSTWGATVDVLATASSASATDAIVEVPVGTTIGGITTSQKFLMIGVSESSTANLTSTATQLIENSCYYLLGMDVPTVVDNSVLSSNAAISYVQTSYSIEINKGVDKVAGLMLYGVSGCQVKRSNTTVVSTFGCKPGVYVLQIEKKNGTNEFKKVVIR